MFVFTITEVLFSNWTETFSSATQKHLQETLRGSYYLIIFLVTLLNCILKPEAEAGVYLVAFPTDMKAFRGNSWRRSKKKYFLSISEKVCAAVS